MKDETVTYKKLSIDEEIEEVNRIFRKNLMLLRASESLTGKELTDRIGMNAKRINDLEEGRVKAKLEDLIRIVDFFPITFDDLLDHELKVEIPSRNK